MKLFGGRFKIGELALDYLEGALGTVATEFGHAALPLRLILCIVGQVFLLFSLTAVTIITSLLIELRFYLGHWFSDNVSPILDAFEPTLVLSS